jgi:hypothetical protein
VRSAIERSTIDRTICDRAIRQALKRSSDGRSSDESARSGDRTIYAIAALYDQRYISARDEAISDQRSAPISLEPIYIYIYIYIYIFLQRSAQIARYRCAYHARAISIIAISDQRRSLERIAAICADMYNMRMIQSNSNDMRIYSQ